MSDKPLENEKQSPTDAQSQPNVNMPFSQHKIGDDLSGTGSNIDNGNKSVLIAAGLAIGTAALYLASRLKNKSSREDSAPNQPENGQVFENTAESIQLSDILHRPPYRTSLSSTTKPLIVTPTFLLRADSTPFNLRPHDEGFTLGNDGQPIENPVIEAPRIALESDPNLAFEHWDEYWRKVHGPKFAYEEPGSSSELVLRYDQIHRIAGGPSSNFRPPYEAMINEDGTLVSDPYACVPVYRRPKWDGFAYIAYGSESDIERVLKQEKYATRVVADEKTAFRMVTRSITREYIIIPSSAHREPISLVKIHQRRDDLTREQFQQRWVTKHVELLLALPATHKFVRRYAQLHNIGSTQFDPEGSLMDGISVFSFASINDVEDYLVTDDYLALEADEATFTDQQNSEFWTAVNYNVINRLFPELASKR